MMSSGDSEKNKASQIQVKFRTTNEKYAVPDTTISIPTTIECEGLNKLIKNLLEESSSSDIENEISKVQFDFILLDELIRGSLSDVLSTKEDVSFETVFEILYIEKQRPPDPKKNVNHDDWVAGVSAMGDFVISACYDNTISIWELETGIKKLTIPGHCGPARAVTWIDLAESSTNTNSSPSLVGTFASTSHDQTVMLYRWDVNANSIECVNACKGHERSVDCVAVDSSKSFLASGSYDTHLKIWDANLQHASNRGNDDGAESDRKRAKSSESSDSKAVTRTPIMTLAGHKEGISGVTWLNSKTEICSASWDHTIKIWDTELGGMKQELVGNKSFFDVSYSNQSKLLITAAAERTLRLYDPRSKDGTLVKSAYTSHTGWVTCCDWRGDDNGIQFLSGSHDNVLKLWDLRSFKTPLFDLSGHTDRILCCDWSCGKYVISGGADNDMKIFKTSDLVSAVNI